MMGLPTSGRLRLRECDSQVGGGSKRRVERHQLALAFKPARSQSVRFRPHREAAITGMETDPQPCRTANETETETGAGSVAARPQRRKRNVTSWNGLSARSIDGPSLAAPSGKGRSSRSVASTDPTSAAAVTVVRARPPSDS